jgi:hypothetical protein
MIERGAQPVASGMPVVDDKRGGGADVGFPPKTRWS